MNIKNVNIKDLIMYENNPRNNDNAVDAVAESIQKFGFKVPMVIDDHNVIVCGHTRYKACLKLGIDQVPCVVADDLNDEQIKAFRIADNRTSEFADWDYNLLKQELEEIENIDMSVFDFEVNEDQDFSPEDLERDESERKNVIITINVPSITSWNTVEDEMKRIVERINATLAVKLQ